MLELTPTTSTITPIRALRIGLLGTFPPTRCGIGKFSESMMNSMQPSGHDLEFDVVRLVDGFPEEAAAGVSALEVIPDLPIGQRAAARRLNQTDVVIIQHEYGIYGANDGEAVLEIVSRLERPAIAVLHSVVAEPTPAQRAIIESLGERCRLVTLSRVARDLLIERYEVSPDSTSVIPHGAAWRALPVNPAPRSKLVTWGLLGPGKGLERALDAVSRLRTRHPEMSYRIVGRTHPAVYKRSGLAYRQSLERLVDVLGLEEVVEFVDRYVGEDELYEMVAASDVVVIPYDNQEQVSSGVLTEAVAAGRPVVATRFPHATELLSTGAGLVVDHDGPALADAIGILLDDDDAYLQAAREASRISGGLQWETCGEAFARLVRSVLSDELVTESVDA